MIETQIPGYEIEGVLGRGHTAIVYRAQFLRLGQAVALKILDPRLASDPEFIGRFRDDLRIAATLEHPNIARVFACGGTGSMCYLSMQLIDGESLGRALQRGAVPVEHAISLVAQIGAALDYAHSRGVIHRDLKPSNVLIRRDGQAFVVDFGLARANRFAALTSPSAGVNAAPYVSPEQCQGARVDHRADLYVLGVILYELLTGRRPFDGPDAMEVYFRHINEPPPPLASVRPGLGRKLQRVIDRAMAKDPDERFRCASDLVAELVEAVDQRKPRPSKESAPRLPSGDAAPASGAAPRKPIALPDVGAVAKRGVEAAASGAKASAEVLAEGARTGTKAAVGVTTTALGLGAIAGGGVARLARAGGAKAAQAGAELQAKLAEQRER
ncbi:MAG: serine/threonine protein kinase, partial [Actinomycetota bacterium]